MAPTPNTHGAGLSIYSQVQAFHDLGCEVEFVFVRTRDNVPSSQSACFKQLIYTIIDARQERPPRHAQLAYWAGWPRELSMWQLYPSRNVLLREVNPCLPLLANRECYPEPAQGSDDLVMPRD
jgi:hypothetical protein